MKALRLGALSVVVGVLGAAAPAFADWRLDDSIRALTDRERAALERGVSNAPSKALERILDEETAHLESLADEAFGPFTQEAWGRLTAAREEGHLWQEIRAVLGEAGVTSRELITRAWQEERERLRTAPDRFVYNLVEEVTHAVLIDRLRVVRDARLEAFRAETGPHRSEWDLDLALRQGRQRFSWQESGGDAGADADGPLAGALVDALPPITILHEEARLREVLFERTFETEYGELEVEAASIDGLARARAGTVSFTDSYGRVVEGVGAEFTARARLNGVRGEFTSEELSIEGRNDLNLRARLFGLAGIASEAEVEGSAVATERGVGVHGEVRVGAGAGASVRIPIDIDLRLLNIRVTPYAHAYAGAGAEAHATLDVEYTGRLRFDIGAGFSTGVGVGAGVVVEIELGDVLKDALSRLIERIEALIRPIADAIVGRSWRGPALESEGLRVSREALERHWEENPVESPDLSTPAKVAQRYAPVLYQRVKEGAADYIRRVDFDGDWIATNNWENSRRADGSAHMYYDVKETETHYFIHYAWFYPRRHASIGLFRHENDWGGCVVVARKNAPRGREVEALLTSDGEGFETYGSDIDDERWDRNYDWWNGEVRFVDEMDHPLVDMERTHVQVWADGRDHDVYGFTGRDDRDPFTGESGVVYVYTGTAETPQSHFDPYVGYALRPISEVMEHMDDPNMFSLRVTRNPRGVRRDYPTRMAGREGRNNAAIPPWAWTDPQHWPNRDDDDRHHRRRPDNTYLSTGDTWVDPARTLAIMFEAPNFSRRYVRNADLGIVPPSRGLTGAVSENN